MATLYDKNSNPLFEFGKRYRNTVKICPFSQIALIGGFGNLAGEVDFWSLENHKEIGKTKAPMWLLPSTALIETAWAMGDGASKYRPYNWRETKVCASTYISAMMRHWVAYLDGEDRAEDSKCHHLAHIVANCNIRIWLHP